MDNKITGDRIKQHLHYDWYKYVAIAAVCIFVFVLAYTWVGNNRSYEELDTMFTCYDFYDADFASDALDYLNENVENNIIRRVNVQEVSPQSNSWGEILSAYGFGDRTSFLILPESKIDEWANTFMCMYNTGMQGGAYNSDVWERIIPEQLREFYAVPGEVATYFEAISRAETDFDEGMISSQELEQIKKDNYAIINSLNENLYLAKDANGTEGVYALRVDNLINVSSYVSFKSKAYEDERYFLVMHYRNGNIGEYGIVNKTREHYESFYLIRFLLTRYGVEV